MTLYNVNAINVAAFQDPPAKTLAEAIGRYGQPRIGQPHVVFLTITDSKGAMYLMDLHRYDDTEASQVFVNNRFEPIPRSRHHLFPCTIFAEDVNHIFRNFDGCPALVLGPTYGRQSIRQLDWAIRERKLLFIDTATGYAINHRIGRVETYGETPHTIVPVPGGPDYVHQNAPLGRITMVNYVLNVTVGRDLQIHTEVHIPGMFIYPNVHVANLIRATSVSLSYGPAYVIARLRQRVVPGRVLYQGVPVANTTLDASVKRVDFYMSEIANSMPILEAQASMYTANPLVFITQCAQAIYDFDPALRNYFRPLVLQYAAERTLVDLVEMYQELTAIEALIVVRYYIMNFAANPRPAHQQVPLAWTPAEFASTYPLPTVNGDEAWPERAANGRIDLNVNGGLNTVVPGYDVTALLI
jgi:hypothetical protein